MQQDPPGEKSKLGQTEVWRQLSLHHHILVGNIIIIIIIIVLTVLYYMCDLSFPTKD